MDSISKIEYIVSNVPQTVADMLFENGYPQISDVEILKKAAQDFVNNEGDYAKKQLLNIHPDKKYFVSVIENKPSDEAKKTPILETKDTQTDEDREFWKDIITTGIIVMGVVIIIKILK